MCGCPLLMNFPKYHAPWSHNNPATTRIAEDPNDVEVLARDIHNWLQGAEHKRFTVAKHFRQHVAIPLASGPLMKRVFAFFRKYPVANKEILKELL
jgi:hypothetical protein